MQPIKLACPHCQALLRTAQLPPAGSMLKCPKCATTFAVPALAPTLAAVEPEEEADDDDRRPRRRKRRRKATDNRLTLIVGLVAGVFLLIIAVAIFVALSSSKPNSPPVAKNTSPVRRPPQMDDDSDDEDGPPGPGRFGGFNGPSFDPAALKLGDLDVGDLAARAPADLEMLKYIPGEYVFLVGADLGNLGSHAALTELAKKLLAQTGDATNSFRDTFGFEMQDADYLIAAGYELASQQHTTTVVVQTKRPQKIEELMQSLGGTPRQDINGRKQFLLTPRMGSFAGDPACYYMPTDRILIRSTLPELRFRSLIRHIADEPGITPEMVALLRGLEPGHLWASVPLTDEFKASFAQGFEQSFEESFRKSFERSSGGKKPDEPPSAEVPEALKQSLAAANFGALTFRLQGKKLHVTGGISFANGDAGSKASSLLETFWKKQIKPFFGLGAIAQPMLQPLYKDLESMKFQAEGPVARLTFEVGLPTIDNLIKEAAKSGQDRPPGRK